MGPFFLLVPSTFTFSRRFYPKRLKSVNTHIDGRVNHARQPARQEQLGLSDLAQGHINTQLGGAGDRTSNKTTGYKTTALSPELSRPSTQSVRLQCHCLVFLELRTVSRPAASFLLSRAEFLEMKNGESKTHLMLSYM